MKTSALIQSLSRWISEIATRMICRCFKAKGKSSLLLKSTNLPFTLYCTFSHHLSSSTSFIPVSLSLPHSLFLSIWHPEMNRCCHGDSCSLSAFKPTVSKRITFTGNLPVCGEVMSFGFFVFPPASSVTEMRITTSLMEAWGVSHLIVYIQTMCGFESLFNKMILVASGSLCPW